MNPNQKPNFTIIYQQKSVPIILPPQVQQLKDLINATFQITNKKILYKDGNDIMEIEGEEDYSEFLVNAINVKFIVAGEDEKDYNSSAQYYSSNLNVDQFELVDSVIPSEEKKSTAVIIKPLQEKEVLVKPDTQEKLSNAVVEQKDQSENATIKMKEMGNQIGDIPVDASKIGCACFLCYGKKTNKKGMPCKRCHGSGTISLDDYNILKKIVAEEAKSCITSMIDEVKSSLSMSMKIGKDEKKEKVVKNPQPVQIPVEVHNPVVNPYGPNPQKNIPLACMYCGTAFKDVYFSCSICPQTYICDLCEQQNFHPHTMKKIYTSVYNEKPKPKEFYNKVVGKLEPVILQPGQDYTYSFTIQNNGPQWPSNTALFFSSGDKICINSAALQTIVGSVNTNASIEAKVLIRAPVQAGTYTAYFRMGYMENDTVKYFGEKPWVTLEVKIDPNSKVLVSAAFDENVNKLVEMGYKKDLAISLLKYSNNDMNYVLQYLTSSPMVSQ